MRVELRRLVDAVASEEELRSVTVKSLGDGFDLQQSIGNHRAFDDLEAPETVSCGGFPGPAAVAHLAAPSRAESRRGASLARPRRLR